MGYQKGVVQTKQVLWELGNPYADQYAATGTLPIFSIPAKCVILSVKAYVATAVTGATSEIVGDGNNDDGYLEDGFAASGGVYPLYAQDSGTTFIGAYAFDSTAGATDALDVSKVPAAKYYSSADTIDYVIGGTATAGKIFFYITFLPLPV